MRIDDFLREILFAGRALKRRPAFSLTVLTVLGLALCANAVLFAIADALLYKRLPFPNASRVVAVWETVGAEGEGGVSYPNFLDWVAQSQSFEALAAYAQRPVAITTAQRSERFDSELVSDAYFRVLGVTPTLGKPIGDGGSGSVAVPEAVISYDFWQTHFSGSPGALGQSVTVEGVAFTVVGVAPAGFRGVSGHVDFWVPMATLDVLAPSRASVNFLGSRDIHWHRVVGLLRPGVSTENARADLDTIARSLAVQYPDANAERGADAKTIREFLIGDRLNPILVLFGAIGLLLLIASANVAGLLSLRGAGREREFSVRAALGAGRARLIRQVGIEIALLVIGSLSLGLILARLTVDAFLAILPIDLPGVLSVSIDYRVALCTLATATLVFLAIGLVGVVQVWTVHTARSLHAGVQSTARKSHSTLRDGLVVFEIALSIVVASAAILLVQSLWRLQSVDAGFDPERLATVRVAAVGLDTPADRIRAIDRMIEAIQSLPDVESASATLAAPLLDPGIQRGFTIDGHEPIPAAERDTVNFDEVAPNYFETMRIPIVAGRTLSDRDDERAANVAVVNLAFARRYWAEGAALGARFKFGPVESDGPWIEIVGIVGNTILTSQRDNPDDSPVVYTPIAQGKVFSNPSLIARTRVDSSASLAAIAQRLERLDSAYAVYGLSTLESRMYDSADDTRSMATLLGVSAVSALLLVAVGLYGVLAFAVVARRREIGVRVAFGASRKDILGLVVRRALALGALGAALGVAASLVLSQTLAGLVFGVKPADPLSHLVGVGFLLVVVLGASAIPAQRASRIEPVDALRCE